MTNNIVPDVKSCLGVLLCVYLQLLLCTPSFLLLSLPHTIILLNWDKIQYYFTPTVLPLLLKSDLHFGTRKELESDSGSSSANPCVSWLAPLPASRNAQEASSQAPSSSILRWDSERIIKKLLVIVPWLNPSSLPTHRDIALLPGVLGGRHIRILDSQHDSVHQILGGLD